MKFQELHQHHQHLQQHQQRRIRRNRFLRWILYVSVVFTYTQWSRKWLLFPLSSTSSSLASFNAELLLNLSTVQTTTTIKSPKPLTMEQTTQPRLFVHIGKAGGTSIQVMVQKSTDKCHELKKGLVINKNINKHKKNINNNQDTIGNNSEEEEDQDQIQDQTCAIAQIESKRVHLKAGQDRYPYYQQFLVNVRNPIDRLISWYNYESQSFYKEPRWKDGGIASTNFQQLKECYPDGIGQIIYDGLLGDTVQKNDDTDDGSISSSITTTTNLQSKSTASRCRKLAKDCLRGDIMCFGHNFYNYEVYGEDLLRWKLTTTTTTTTSPEPKNDIRVDVIRSEHSMEDFETIIQLWTQPVVDAKMKTKTRSFLNLNKINNNDDNQETSFQLTDYVRGLYGKVRTIEDYQVKPKKALGNGGKNNNNNNNNKNNNAQDKNDVIAPVNKSVSQEAVTALCRWICTELKTYKYLLQIADNLSEYDVQTSFNELDERCQINVDQECGTDWEYRNIKQQKKVFDMPW
ncbi:sulfotransferase family protein [Nitzschia inconspicua]|uniref:Sulfotransferase family protein n=1 Tax=Nitzschia inconspicua TaxID=303405 RepID=A0A9K3M1W9_9STRA|nr:sulfotransferase family protein [Nitzschia inconspicua]